MSEIQQDVWAGVRNLRRTPVFTAIVILTLALGTGVATAVSAVGNAIVLRKLPVVDQDRLVLLSGRTRDGRIDNYPLGIDAGRDFGRNARLLSETAYFGYEGAVPKPVRIGDQVTRLSRSLVSGNYFAVLGARPILGRALRAEDDVEGAAPVLVLSYRAWTERFGGRPDVLGRRVTMLDEGVEYAIIGVMPQGLDYPRGSDAWAAVFGVTPKRSLRFISLEVLGRLARGVSPTDARSELDAFLRRADAPVWQRNLTGVVHSLPELVIGDTKLPIIAFAAAAGLLLLITCINVANLLLVRGLGRVQEMAVRQALGASRWRTAKQLIVEHGMLAVGGGLLGGAIAALGIRLFAALAPANLPRVSEIEVNVQVMFGAISIVGLAMLLFGVAPAINASRVELVAALRSGTRQTVRRGFRRGTEALVVCQVALALMVLSAAGLVVRSFVELGRVGLSFDPSHVMIADLALRYDQYQTVAAQRGVLERVLQAVHNTAGIVAVSPAVARPFAGTAGWDGQPSAEGQTPTRLSDSPLLNMEVVTPEYFAALGVPVLRGRGFTAEDAAGSVPVALLSVTAARYFWPGQDPIGKRINMGTIAEPRLITIVGTVPETRYRDLRQARPSVYFPLAQSFFPFVPTTLIIRTSMSPAHLTSTLRKTVATDVPGVNVADIRPFDAFLAEPLGQPRLNAVLLSIFGAASGLLAALGLFSVTAAMVRQRTREFGVRMALGASSHDVIRAIVGRGMLIAGVGTAAGLLASVLVNRVFTSMMFQVTPLDFATLSVVCLGLLAVSALASWIPAHRGGSIDPVSAMRVD